MSAEGRYPFKVGRVTSVFGIRPGDLDTADEDALKDWEFEAVAPGSFISAWARNANFTVGNMKKNVAGQKVGAQLVSATDGSVFTGAVTVYITGDAGTQAIGSVGGGACTSEGNGYHTYAPAQAETNYDLIAFTFIGTGAVAATVQVYCSFPQTTDNPANLPNAGALSNLDAAVSSRMATYTQPTGFLAATFPGTVASTTNITAGTITTATNVTTVNGLAAGVITAASIAADAITDAKVAADVTIASVTGAVGSVTGNVGGSVNSVTNPVDANVVSATADAFESTDFDTTYYGAMAGAIWDALLITYVADGSLGEAVGLILAKTNNLPASPASTTNISVVGSVTGLTNATISDAVWDEPIAGHLTAGSTGEALDAASSGGDPWGTALPGAYGAGTAGNIIGNNLNAPVGDVPTALENADALLNRDMSAVSDTNARSPLNALRGLRNKSSIVADVLTVTKEDDTTTAWTAATTPAPGADPISAIDPT